MPANVSEPSCWFAARTRYGQELKIKSLLTDMGVEHFIPTHEVIKISAGHKRKVTKPLISNLIFVRSTKADAFALVNYRGLPFKYIIDRQTHTLLLVPEKQMADFIRVVSSPFGDTGALEENLEVGDNVRVVWGDLAGVEGRVAQVQNKTYIVVDLCGLLQAKAVVPQA
ncbi:MAG: UpxY family transcription antiterminator, partial [Bacteroidales bacterium]|nr:UpxY family transcription antiterminator [Bacteroidales bacterium]